MSALQIARSPSSRGAHTRPANPVCVNRSRRNALARFVAAIALLLAGRATAQDPLPKLQLKIAAGSAPAALAEFIRQTGLQVLFETDAIRDHLTHAVIGLFSAAEALALMLEGSGLVFEFINERTITVRPRPTSQTAGGGVAAPPGKPATSRPL